MLMGREELVALDYGANISFYCQCAFSVILACLGVVFTFIGLAAEQKALAGIGCLMMIFLPFLNAFGVFGSYLIAHGISPEAINYVPTLMGLGIVVVVGLISRGVKYSAKD
jgi:hypothetical protein